METTHILCEVEDSSVELQVSTCKVRQLYTQRVGKVLSQEAPPHAVVGVSHSTFQFAWWMIGCFGVRDF